jgi:hypothetical protein
VKLRYDRWLQPIMAPLGMGPRFSSIDVDRHELRVRMGWAFDAVIPLTNIVAATPTTGRVFSRGVHGGRGRWLVNGSSRGVVDLVIDPAVAARAMGFPIRLRKLSVSVTDPDALIASVSTR